MCWRDEIIEERFCDACGMFYYGDLGHRDCPFGLSRGNLKQPESVSEKDEVKPVKKEKEIDRPF